MKRLLIAFCIIAVSVPAVGIPALNIVVPTTVHAAPFNEKCVEKDNCCKKTGSNDKNTKCCKKQDKGYCADENRVPTHGDFVVKVTGTTVKLAGLGSGSSAGGTIYISRVAPPNLRKHMQAFKVFGGTHMPTLKLATKGTLFQYVPAKGTWNQISTFRSSGIYGAVLA